MEWSDSFEISFSCETDSAKDLFNTLFNDKMKKDLKKKYGDMWIIHHPNTETVYNFS